MKGLSKVVLINLTLIIIICIGFELALRIWTPDFLIKKMSALHSSLDSLASNDRSWPIEKKDGIVVGFKPNSSFNVYHNEYQYVAHTDEYGFRSNHINYHDTGSHEIIPVLGDSWVFGLGVKDFETFLRILQNNSRNISYLNGGIPGSCLANQIDIIEKRVHELPHFDRVFFGFYLGNDLEDLLKYDSSSAIETKNKTHKGLLWTMNIWLNSSILRHSYLVQYTKAGTIRLINRSSQDKIVSGGFLIMDKRNVKEIAQAKSRLHEQLERLKKIEDRLGFRSFFFLLPSKFQIGDELRQEQCNYYNLDSQFIDPEIPRRLVSDELKQFEFTFVDLTYCMRKLRNPERCFYVRDHLNSLGNEALFNCLKDPLDSMLSNN